MSKDKTKQDVLLDVMQDQSAVDLLYDLWQIVKNTPTRAAEILVQFKDVSRTAKEMNIELQETILRFDSLRKRLPDIMEAADMMREANNHLTATDDKALNRLNRIIDAAEKIRELKATGALDLLKNL